MAKTHIPAWQQVVMQALRAVPGANGGQVAWNMLAPDEQRAVIDFAAARCEGDVQPILEDIRQQIKPRGEWRWLWEGALVVDVSVAMFLLLRWLDKSLGAWADSAALFLVVAVILWKLCPYPEQTQRFWHRRRADYDSTLAALEKMQKHLHAPDWPGVFLWIGLLAAVMLVDALMAV